METKEEDMENPEKHSDDGEDKNDAGIGSSELGTKKYWDEAYEEEVTNFDDHGAVGEIWFGKGVVERLVSWLDKGSAAAAAAAGRRTQIEDVHSVLDLGTGNGAFLLELWKRGYRDLTGVDYSEAAIRLAKRVTCSLVQHQDGGGSQFPSPPPIRLEVGNILELNDGRNKGEEGGADNNHSASSSSSSCPIFGRIYDVCTDKGTYDAISLDPEDADRKRALYVSNVRSLLSPPMAKTGFFLITSCNWTKPELVQHFQNDFELLEEIEMPQFRFGGKVGQKVTSLVFRAK